MVKHTGKSGDVGRLHCISTALHIQFSIRRLSYVYISTFDFFVFFFMLCSAVFSFLYRNDMVCQQITVQTVQFFLVALMLFSDQNENSHNY